MSHNTHSTVGQNAGRVLYPRGTNDCQMQIANCKLQIADRRALSPVPRPLSPPRGISLTEVLIAMGILTVGLLGVAAIFPVAGFYMQKGEVADRGSAIAQAAFNKAITSGQLDPAGWWTMTRNYTDPTTHVVPASDGLDNTFSRPVANAVASARAAWQLPLPACQRVGSVYVIDPLGSASLTDYANPMSAQKVARPFPASAGFANLTDYYGQKWATWLPNNGPRIWPIRRVTFRQPLPSPHDANPAEFYPTTTPLNRVAAENLFTSSDDLSIDMPQAADKPSIQQMNLVDNSGQKSPLARQSKGDYSWLFTVVPADQYDLYAGPAEVSAVVFYKRPLDYAPPTTNPEGVQASINERMTKASIVSTGLNGGEVLLAPVIDAISESPFKSLKVDRWIMLCGPHPNSTNTHPMFVARWYRVLAIETEGANRRVTLRGPKWPWEPQNGSSELSNNLCAGIFPGAVAVHSKTVRLGGGSAWQGGSSGVLGGAAPPKFVTH